MGPPNKSGKCVCVCVAFTFNANHSIRIDAQYVFGHICRRRREQSPANADVFADESYENAADRVQRVRGAEHAQLRDACVWILSGEYCGFNKLVFFLII